MLLDKKEQAVNPLVRKEREEPGGLAGIARVNRRQVLTTLGAAGVLTVAGGLLSGGIASALEAGASAGAMGNGAAGKKPGNGNGNGSPHAAIEELREELEARMRSEAILTAVNLSWYGAAGDGITDDTAAWNAAMADVPAGGALYVPPGTYYSASGFLCGRGDITIFGAGPSSHLTTEAQTNTLLIGKSDRTTRVRNVNVHSLKFSQKPGPSGSGGANNFAGVKVWFVDRAVVHNNDFEECDVCISFGGGNSSLGFPGRVTYRNAAVMNRMLNTNKMGVEVFFQNHAIVYANQMINEDDYKVAESHAVRLIGSHHSMCCDNDVYRFRTGVSTQGGNSLGYRESDHFLISGNKFRQCVKGVQGFEGAYNGQVLMNVIEHVREFGIEFRQEKNGGWDHLIVEGNLISADPNSTSGGQRGATFTAGQRLVFRGNQSVGFGNSQTSGTAYHVYVSAIGRIAVIEGNYFEDSFYLSSGSRNLGVRVLNNEKTVISRNNVFVSPSPNPAEQNAQSSGSGQLVKGFPGLDDMNDYFQG
jgi:hypothetical protein